MSNPKTCFVIAPIGEEGTETRKRADQVFKHVIRPVAKELGYDPEMPHHVNEPGSISTQIIERILNADLVVADLTDHNPNVMYELAVRHAARRPVVQIIQKGQKLPFDISQQRTISLDHKDMDSVEEAKNNLRKQIEAVQRDPSQVDSPITVAVNLTSLKGSEKPTDTALVEIMSMLQEIRTEQQNLSRAVGFAPNPTLTEREREILRMVGEGLSNIDIANKLSISDRNVRQHLSSVYDKITGAKSASLAQSLGAYERLLQVPLSDEILRGNLMAALVKAFAAQKRKSPTDPPNEDDSGGMTPVAAPV
jgi:DNA-binding CsgD family transcriptional regulator